MTDQIGQCSKWAQPPRLESVPFPKIAPDLVCVGQEFRISPINSRDELKFDNVSNMTEAFRLLSGGNEEPTLISTVRRREKRYSYHPICNVFPRMPTNEFHAFVEDIRENGLSHPITLYKGQILD